jgi:hypothetical protein
VLTAPRSSWRPLLASNAFAALVVFALTFSVAGFSVQRRLPLGDVARLTDEWYTLGVNVASRGVLGLEDEPILLRAPGYPFFIAVSLWTFAGDPRPVTWAYLDRGQYAVYLAQAVVLAATAAVLYLWLLRVGRRRVALVSALAFGLNPYSVVLTTLLHYDVLHIFFLVSGGWALGSAFEAPGEGRRWPWLGAGLVWGLATLVRPITLLLPAFVLAALFVRRGTSRRDALRSTALFGAGLALAVLPWTARNYSLSGRLIPVNDQGWAAVWGSTTKPLGTHPNHYKWYSLLPEQKQIYLRVSGRPDFDYLTYVRANRAYEAAFREEALRNLRRSPGVYLGNAVAGVVSLCLDINSVFLKAYEYRQATGVPPQTSWFIVGHPQGFHPGGTSRAFAAYATLMTVLAAGGLLVAFRGRDPRVLAPAAVFACLAFGHAIAYMDLMYYYQRVPFLFVFASFLVDRAQGRHMPLPGLGRRIPLGPLLLLAVASGVVLTPVLLAP